MKVKVKMKDIVVLQLVTLSEAWDMDDRDLDETLGNTSQNDIVLNDTWETESSEDEEEGGGR